MKLLATLALLTPAAAAALGCADYGADGIHCAGRQCYECHQGFCSTDGPGPSAPNCGDDLAEPTLATACDSAGDLHACAVAAAAACQDNAECHSFSLDPSWGATKAKLWRNNGTGLVANADWNTWVPTNKTAPPAPAPAPPGTCHTDLDCSLNGVCDVNGTRLCVCDKPWSGEACETLNFKPVAFPQGYGMAPNATTWGGGIIFDSASRKHHLFVSRMTNDCPLADWTHNSRIDHAVSTTGPEGPYEFADVAVDTWAHNAAPLALPDGTFAIVHIGMGTGGPDGGKNCTPATSDDGLHDQHGDEGPVQPQPADKHIHPRLDADASGSRAGAATAAAAAAGSTIHVAKSLDGPWTPLANDLGGCNNPAPWVHPNGTIYIGCGGSLRRADHIAGPYTTVASFPMQGGPPGNYEDPQVYTDSRGHFHCLYHVYTTNLPSFQCENSTVSAHAFSADGLEWHMSAASPYGTQVALASGGIVTVATRERPKPFFRDGVMTHLLNGVCGSAMCATPSTHAGCVDCKYAQWDYTLVAPLEV